MSVHVYFVTKSCALLKSETLIVYETKRTTTSCHAGIKLLKQVAGPAESRHAIGLVPSPTITILQKLLLKVTVFQRELHFKPRR